jgi:hypothetical protein
MDVHGMNVLYSKTDGWLVRSLTGFEPATEHQAFITLIVDGYDAHDARDFMKWIRSIEYRQFREPFYIADAKQYRWFVADENGLGRRMNKTVARHALMFDGASRQIADVMLRACRHWPIYLADLTRISRAA